MSRIRFAVFLGRKIISPDIFRGGEKIFLNKFASRNQGVLSLMDNICLAEIQSAAISQAI